MKDADLCDSVKSAKALGFGPHAHLQALLLQQAFLSTTYVTHGKMQQTTKLEISNTAHLAQSDKQVKDVGIVVEQSACSAGCIMKGLQLQPSAP